MKVKFKQWDCVAIKGTYPNGRKAIQLYDLHESLTSSDTVAVATVNLVDATPTSDQHIFVKDYSENEGMADALITAGIIKSSIVQLAQSGFVTIGEYELTGRALKQIFNE